MSQVKTQFFNFEKPYLSLPNFRLAYETYGTLNEDKSNAVLLFHAISGSQHASGQNTSLSSECEFWNDECTVGWWDKFIGPGSALDTNDNFVICVNFIGGCYGSTGPSAINPETGKHYGSSFPEISVNDIVDTQRLLLAKLEIPKLKAVVGPSVGCMCALNFACRYPNEVSNVVCVAGGHQISVIQRLHRLEQIRAIELDGDFNGGDYYDSEGPKRGLALARSIAHKTYISLQTLEERAQSSVKTIKQESDRYQLTHPVESYMESQGWKFTERFDPNSYLLFAKAWQKYDLLKDCDASSSADLFSRCSEQKFLIVGIDSDVCFYPEDQLKLAAELRKAGTEVNHITIHSSKGHDAFLLEPELISPAIRSMLK